MYRRLNGGKLSDTGYSVVMKVPRMKQGLCFDLMGTIITPAMSIKYLDTQGTYGLHFDGVTAKASRVVVGLTRVSDCYCVG